MRSTDDTSASGIRNDTRLVASIGQQSRFDRTIQTEKLRTSLSQTKLGNVTFKVLMVDFLAEARSSSPVSSAGDAKPVSC
jgi:hypothetical protein